MQCFCQLLAEVHLWIFLRVRWQIRSIVKTIADFLWKKGCRVVGNGLLLLGILQKVIRYYELNDCDDSTSALTTKKIYFTSGTSTEFSMDVCIVVMNDQGNYERLIHEKTGCIYWNRYFWNEAPNSTHVKKKADYIKSQGCWSMVRDQYREIKNRYLVGNDRNHPSFICYVEAVNNVYDQIKMKRRRQLYE